MPPLIALVMCTTLVLGALLFDSRRTPSVSKATWIPLIWLAILASRPIGQWLSQSRSLGVSVEDGSPLDRLILSTLMLLALAVLIRRRLQWDRWIKENAWIVVFFIFCGISIAWSEFPAVSSKRWIRGLGGVLMILVVLSEEDPLAAIAAMVRRCAYVLLPLSIILIKYYREYGVGYNYWTGGEFLVGVTTDKNALGRLCLIAGLFATWELIAARQYLHKPYGIVDKLGRIAVIGLSVWLLLRSNSATALASFLLGCCVLIAFGHPTVRNRVRYLGTLITLGAGAAAFLLLETELWGFVLTSLGRDPTLTGRTFLWHALLGMGTNPLSGVGYDSFWIGDRLVTFVRKYNVNEAHNGYLEVYLDLGIVGLLLFVCVVFSVFVKAKRSLVTDVAYGRLRMALLAVFLIYNVTESGYKPTTLICFALLMVAIEIPSTLKSRRPQTLASTRRPGAATNQGVELIANDPLHITSRGNGHRPVQRIGMRDNQTGRAL